MIRTQLYLPEEMYRQAKLNAMIEGVSISEFVRDGISIKLAKKQSKSTKSKNKDLSSLVGMFKSTDGIVTNVALNHNDIYDE